MARRTESAAIETLGRTNDPDFENIVFPEELEYQQHRRRRWTEVDGRPELDPADGLTVDNNLVGLALSGGGIRSATFNLGVVQALHKAGVFPMLDYLSTVSGGGYLGSALSSWLRDPPVEAGADPFPFPLEDGREEPALLAYIRNHANFLTPRGPASIALMLAVLVRGIALNLMLLAPVVFISSLVVALVYGWTLNGEAATYAYARAVPAMLVLGFAAIVAYPVLSLIYRLQLSRRLNSGGAAPPGLPTRSKVDRWYTRILVLLVVAVGIDIQPSVLLWFNAWDPMASGGRLMGEGAFVLAGGAISTLTAMSAYRRQKVTRPLLLLAGLAGGTFGPYLAFLFITAGIVFDDSILATVLDPAAAWLFGPEFLEPLLGTWPDWVLRALVVTFVGLALSAGGLVLVDVNVTSMATYYRDRLSPVFVVGVEDGLLGPAHDLPLSALCPDDSGAPYHLVNAAVNLQASRDPDLRGRNADFFVFSRFFVGGRKVGWCRTEDYEGAAPWIHLGTAMATSGAAAAPNMGTFTNSLLVPILVLLNVRLGIWAPNPKRVPQEPLKRKPVDGRRRPERYDPIPFQATAEYLVREMAGSLHEGRKAVYLSDGGHIENLGVYELLRRRCRLIIVGDGESDSGMTMGALATLIRYARIDLGVEIDVDPGPLRPRPVDPSAEGGSTTRAFSEKHVVVGKIRYPSDGIDGGEIGWMIYVKSTLTGDEELVVQHRGRVQPEFPHESTADQFFDEGQFEAYRSLGVHAFGSFWDSLPGSRLRRSTEAATTSVSNDGAEPPPTDDEVDIDQVVGQLELLWQQSYNVRAAESSSM